MPEYWAMGVSGIGNSRVWKGPYNSEDAAKDAAVALLLSGRIPDNPGLLFKFQNLYLRAFYGQRFKELGPGGKPLPLHQKWQLFGTWIWDRELGDNRGIVSDLELAGAQFAASEGLEDVCFGPLLEDWCDPCAPIDKYLNDPVLSQVLFQSLLSVGVITPNCTDSDIASLVEVRQEEIDYFAALALPDTPEIYDWFEFGQSSNESGTRNIGLYGGFWQLPPKVLPGDVEGLTVDVGNLKYTPAGENWGPGGARTVIMWLPPVDPMTGETLPYWPFNGDMAGVFDVPSSDTWGPDEKVQTYLYKYKWFAECYASYGESLAPQTASWFGNQDESGGIRKINNGVMSGELPAEAFTLQGDFWGQAYVHFAHIGEVPEVGVYIGWTMAVRIQITPFFIVASNDMSCAREIMGGPTTITIMERSDRNQYPDGGGAYFNSTFPDPGGEYLERADNENAPFATGKFVDAIGPESDLPPGPPKDRKFLGWSGNGIPLAALLILNPSWFVQGFLENYSPFKAVPGYKYIVEFIQFITGGRSQYTPLGTDPDTGEELYPVPVIVGADEGGFPVYGKAVYSGDTGDYYGN